jgi:hypothetical protein
MFKSRFMSVLLTATHHMKPPSPKLCGWSIPEQNIYTKKLKKKRMANLQNLKVVFKLIEECKHK